MFPQPSESEKMHFVIELLVASLIVLGSVFTLVGSFGLVKLPDLMTRLHAPTKATTLGVGGVLAASMVYFAGFEGVLSIHEVLISVFLFLTAPVTAQFIAKAYLHRHPDKEGGLPKPESGRGWSTYDAPPDASGPTEQVPDKTGN